MTTTNSELTRRFTEYREKNPDTRIRTAAKELGCSEAELVATGVDGDVIRLRPDVREIILEIEKLGEVMALTRNDGCVHEKHGVYTNVIYGERGDVVANEDIDLRIFFSRWRFAFAVKTEWDGSPDGIRRSLQFFDMAGDAVHKIFLTRKSNVEAWDALVAKYSDADLDFPQLEPAPVDNDTSHDADVDADALMADWANLNHTHSFFPMIRKHRVSRLGALRLAEGRYTERVEADSARGVLDAAAESGTPIMAFVGNRGCIQIHTGPVKQLKEHGPWYNVLDPGFNLHLNESAIDQSWVVVKPTDDGDITALEVYDAAGEIIVQFFGKRKDNDREDERWREIVGGLRRVGSVVIS